MADNNCNKKQEVMVLKENVNSSETSNQANETGLKPVEKENVELQTTLDREKVSSNGDVIAVNGESNGTANKSTSDGDEKLSNDIPPNNKSDEKNIANDAESKDEDVADDTASKDKDNENDAASKDAGNGGKQTENEVNNSSGNNSDEGISIIEERLTPKELPSAEIKKINQNQTMVVQQISKNAHLPKLASIDKNMVMPVQYGLMGSNGRLLIPTNNISGSFPVAAMGLPGSKVGSWKKPRLNGPNILRKFSTAATSRTNVVSLPPNVKIPFASATSKLRVPSVEDRMIAYLSKMRIPLNMVNMCYALRDYLRYHELNTDPLNVDFDKLLSEQLEDEEKRKALRSKRKRKVEEIVIIDDDAKDDIKNSDKKQTKIEVIDDAAMDEFASSAKDTEKSDSPSKDSNNDAAFVETISDIEMKDVEDPSIKKDSSVETSDKQKVEDGEKNVVDKDCGKIAEKPSDEKTNDTIKNEEFAGNLPEKKTAEKLSDKKTAEKLNDKKIAENLSDKKIAENLSDKKIAENLSDEKNAEKLSDDKSEEKLSDDKSEEKLSEEKVSDEKSSDEKYAEKDEDEQKPVEETGQDEKPSTKTENSKAVDKEAKASKGEESDSEVKVINETEGTKDSTPKVECFTDDVDPEHENVACKLRPVARYLYFLGLDFAKEKIYKDIIKSKTNAARKRKLNEEEEQQLNIVKYGSMKLAKRTRPFQYKDLKKCSCGFSSESSTVLYSHHQRGHMDKYLRYSCALCEFETRLCKDFLFHMESIHNMQGKVQSSALWECPMCPFESGAKNKVTRHRFKCEQKFDVVKHLFPCYDDINFLFRSLPGELIKKDLPKNSAPRPSPIIPAIPSVNSVVTTRTVAPPNVAIVQPTVVQQSRSLIEAGKSTTIQQSKHVKLPTIIQAKPQVYYYMTANGPVPITVQSGISTNAMPPKTVMAQSGSFNSIVSRAPAAKVSVSKKRPVPSNAAQKAQPSAKVANKYEICEICSGFIKDKESLRIHFMMAHKIEINSEMFTRRSTPPLSCDVCNNRFWTFQGLTHHRVIKKHRVPEGGICHLCSQPATKMHTHLTMYHNLDTVNARVLKVCPVCGITITPEGIRDMVYHLQVSHSIVLPNGKLRNCKICGLNFANQKMFEKHVLDKHGIRCPRCPIACKSQGELQKHLTNFHGMATQYCLICKKTIMRGKPYINHVCQMHIRKCVVKLTRCNVLKMKLKMREQKRLIETTNVDDDDDDVQILDNN